MWYNKQLFWYNTIYIGVEVLFCPEIVSKTLRENLKSQKSIRCLKVKNIYIKFSLSHEKVWGLSWLCQFISKSIHLFWNEFHNFLPKSMLFMYKLKITIIWKYNVNNMNITCKYYVNERDTCEREKKRAFRWNNWFPPFNRNFLFHLHNSFCHNSF